MKKITIFEQMLIVVLMFFGIAAHTQDNSYTFEVQKSGQGNQSIIFIPGFACSGDVWNETRSAYESNFTCYTLTMAGFANVKPQPDASFINWELSIAKFIMDNKIEKPIIVGHSMGGGLALSIAADYPDLAGKIIVVDALPCMSAMMNPSFKSVTDNDCSPMIDQITAMTDDQFYQMQKMTMPQLIADTSKLKLVVNWSVQSDRETFATMYCDFLNTDLRDKIATIKCPALILLETNFAFMKPAIEEQYKNLKTAKLQYAGKGLHFIMYDDTDWYMSQLDNFITTN